MTTPHCPHCRAASPGCLALQKLDQFGLVYCNHCGAIFGVISLPSSPKGRAIPAEYDDLTVAELTHVLTRLTGQYEINLTSNQIEQMFREAANTSNSPLCSQHGPAMVLLTIPFGFNRSAEQFWICRHYRTCRQWQIASPPKIETVTTWLASPEQPQIETPAVGIPAARLPQSAQAKPKQKPSLETIGNADLSNKLPYDPVQIANRMRAAGLGSSSRYLQIAIDDGPPICSQHKVEMAKATIPDGYKNSGREVWLCPQFNACGQWELAG